MGNSTAKEGNFGFGFNDVDFSDRILRLEIIPALASNMNSGGNKYLNWFSSLDAANNSACGGGTDLKLKKLHINSLILAAKSPFFYKLFKNGMRVSQQRDEVTLRIAASEEVALMDLLKFIYGNPLSASSAPDLVDVLMAADKFEVTYCVRYCVDLLLDLPMSTESALLYLELPSSVLEDKVVQKLNETAKQYLASHYRDFTESQEEAMGLPLCAIEVVLGSDGLQVDSEDAVFDFILKWARLHYPKLGERREILTKRLVHLMCLPNMSSSKLKEVAQCPYFDREELSELVLNAFLSKDQVLPTTTNFDFPRRVYGYRLIKVVQLELAQPRCVVYLDLKKQECPDLLPSKPLSTQEFRLGGRSLFLFADCAEEQLKFGLIVLMTETSETCTIDFEFAVMNKFSKEFTKQVKTCKCTATKEGMGLLELFETPWTKFMSDDSEYFIDGILHVRADLTLINCKKHQALIVTSS